jgi:hypothetical protein
MHILVAALVYYLVGSVIAGSILGAGFATNLSGRPNDRQLRALQRIGTYIPLNLNGIDGGLIARATQKPFPAHRRSTYAGWPIFSMESVRTDAQHNFPNSNIEQIAAEWRVTALPQIERRSGKSPSSLIGNVDRVIRNRNGRKE